MFRGTSLFMVIANVYQSIIKEVFQYGCNNNQREAAYSTR